MLPIPEKQTMIMCNMHSTEEEIIPRDNATVVIMNAVGSLFITHERIFSLSSKVRPCYACLADMIAVAWKLRHDAVCL